MTRSSFPPAEITVTERVRTADLVWFAITAALVAATPWMLMDASGETVEYRDSRGMWQEGPAEVGLLLLVAAVVLSVGLKAFNLLRGPVAVGMDGKGIRLFADAGWGMHLRKDAPVVAVPWDEVERLVVWRRPGKLLGLIPVRTTMLGVEKSSNWYEVSQREPSERQRRSEGHRKNGVPVRLGHMMLAQSVRLSGRAAADVATGAARFAPGVEVVDERRAGAREVIAPKAERNAKTY
ncbi:hypothetical protein [Glycomyces arizonensis]|uniref:hypothetical protein n=1 Tax=Glycomyces arizonensis TaxID=256035 RepID=UPI0004269B07|nr:hypothetical protein [Glycomyces arizonensis]